MVVYSFYVFDRHGTLIVMDHLGSISDYSAANMPHSRMHIQKTMGTSTRVFLKSTSGERCSGRSVTIQGSQR